MVPLCTQQMLKGLANKSSVFWKGWCSQGHTRIPSFPLALQHSFLHDTADMFFCLLAACVAVVSVIEQLAQVHNSTVETSMERLCSYLPGKYRKGHVAVGLICFLTFESS